MPIYEYQCSSCGHQMESLQKVTDAPLTDCPRCNKPGLQKLISAAGFQLKGTGWYVTDFRDKGKAKSGETTTSSSTKKKDDSSSSSNSTTGDASV